MPGLLSPGNGNPFKCFYCPILQTDEETELCMGHIVNKSIPNSCRKCVVQRKDVDGFYGAVVEADFATLIQARGKGLLGAVFDPALSKKVRSKVMWNGEECRYHADVGDEPAPTQSLVLLENDDGAERRIVLHAPPAAVTAAKDQNWQLVIEGDYRIPARLSVRSQAVMRRRERMSGIS